MRVVDLFAVGLGFDFVGAYLLGRGLLTSAATIMARATPRYDFHVGLALGQAEDRVDATAGIGSLLAGFAIQACAYGLGLTRASDRGTWVDAALLVGISVVVAGGALALWRYGLRARLLRKALVELAHWDGNGQRSKLPSARRLQDFGMALGASGTIEEVTPGGTALYAKRVFDVDLPRDDVE